MHESLAFTGMMAAVSLVGAAIVYASPTGTVAIVRPSNGPAVDIPVRPAAPAPVPAENPPPVRSPSAPPVGPPALSTAPATGTPVPVKPPVSQPVPTLPPTSPPTADLCRTLGLRLDPILGVCVSL